jgi:hypothetical protein
METTLVPVFRHPFSLILASPSNGGKSTLAFNIIKNSKHLVDHGFDSVFVLYKSYQPLYERMKKELDIPVYLFEKTLPEDLETLKGAARYPVVLIDDGFCPENQDLIVDLFCRLGHHLSVSVILICQTLFDAGNPSLRICHRNTKALIVFACPRDQGTLRTLVHQMLPDRKKAQQLISTLDDELRKPYNYVLFDFDPKCPIEQRFKTNILCEREPYPVALTFKKL